MLSKFPTHWPIYMLVCLGHTSSLVSCPSSSFSCQGLSWLCVYMCMWRLVCMQSGGTTHTEGMGGATFVCSCIAYLVKECVCGACGDAGV